MSELKDCFMCGNKGGPFILLAGEDAVMSELHRFICLRCLLDGSSHSDFVERHYFMSVEEK